MSPLPERHEWRPCPSCGTTRGLDCNLCDGAGGLRPTVATIALIDRFGPHAGEALYFLRQMVKRPTELVAALEEWEILEVTGFSLDLAPRDPTVAKRTKGYVAPGTRAPVKGHEGRFGPLYRIVSK